MPTTLGNLEDLEGNDDPAKENLGAAAAAGSGHDSGLSSSRSNIDIDFNMNNNNDLAAQLAAMQALMKQQQEQLAKVKSLLLIFLFSII